MWIVLYANRFNIGIIEKASIKFGMTEIQPFLEAGTVKTLRRNI